MGLDMYLTKKIYVGANYKHNKVEGSINLTKEGKKLNIDLKKVTYIEQEAGYWRKANAIHSWFVENVQNGEDDCKPYWVSKENLEELKALCEKVLKSTNLVDGKCYRGERLVNGQWEVIYEDGKVLEDSMIAEEFLPTKDGFFFGGTQYNEDYWQDLLDTVSIIEKILKEWDDNTEIYYQSSW